MSSDIAIKVENLSKCYQIYEQPRDRLKQFVLPNFQHILSQQPKQYYKEFWALKSVSFEVKKGETVGIIGRNGSGKSTLLQMICGTINPTSGIIATQGRIAALLELGSGFNPEFTGRENVYLNGAILGLTHQEIEARFTEIITFADIGDFLDQPVKIYSSGMVVRLAFAVAVAVDPDILVVDEALAVGDEAFQRKCFARIENIKKNGGTILFVTHDTQLILEICDRTILLNSGESIYFGNSHQAVNLYYKLTDKIKKSDLTDLPEKLIKYPEIENNNTTTLNSLNSNEKNSKENINAFDESLTSETQHIIHEKHYGITLSDIKLNDKNNKISNILTARKYYKVNFIVDFDKKPNHISYQVLFKTINGIPIAGNKFLHHEMFETMPTIGNKYNINYEFQCLLNPGVYFISVEACGIEQGKSILYHKFAEVIAFRVIEAEKKISAIGYFNLQPKIDLKEF